MGVKGVLFIGGALILTMAVWLGMKKEGELCVEKAERLIREVDEKKEEAPEPQTVEEMSNDVDSAVADMDLTTDDDETI